MANQLENLFIELSQNADLYQAYIIDPIATAAAFGVSEDDIALIDAGDSRAIRSNLLERVDYSAATIRAPNVVAATIRAPQIPAATIRAPNVLALTIRAPNIVYGAAA